MRFKTFYLKETENGIPKILYHGSNFNFSKFDLKFIGKGEGLQKFGFGIYLTDTEELSNFYATQLKGTQIIYKCRIPSDSRLYEWDSPVDDYLHNKFINYLNENDFEKDAEKLQDEYEQYNEYMDFESYYKILSHLVGSPKKASESFVNFGIDGCISNDISNRGKIYVIFDASLIKIIDKDILNESEERNHGKLLSELKPSLKTVMIFRARDSKGDEFDSKDYVTLSSKFALEHAESNHVYNDDQYIVIRATVPTNQLAEASNPGEWFYIGPKIHGDVVYKSLGPDDYEGKIIDLKFARKLKL